MTVPKNPYKGRIKFRKVSEKTGVNSDYSNEFISCKAILIKYEENSKKIYEKMKEYYPRSFMKYTQRGKYRAAQKSEGQFGYQDIIINAFRRYKQRKAYSVTRKNKRQVKYLDRIVDELNGMLENPSKFSYGRTRTLTDRAYVLIYGEKNEKIYQTGAGKNSK